jgi:hypothetical protein
MKANDAATIGSGGMTPSPLPSADASARVERAPLPGKFEGELRQAITASSDHKRARANVERGGRAPTGGTKHTLTVTKRPWLFMLRPQRDRGQRGNQPLRSRHVRELGLARD